MSDHRIEHVSVHVVGPETERYTWASDMHSQYMTNTILRARTRSGLEGIAGVASFSEFGFDRAVGETNPPFASPSHRRLARAARSPVAQAL